MSCVTCISDRQKAASCAHFYVSHLPGGADKLAAAESFHSLASGWLAEEELGGGDPDKREAILQALLLTRNNLQRLQMEDALRRRGNGLWNEELASMVHTKTPEELVCRLLEDPSIFAR